MLLAFSRDLRVVLLRLASRLQTLRFFAQTKTPCPPEIAREALDIFAPLANRLGLWQIKWELEDLSFRFLHPEPYHAIAKLLDEKRVERERRVEAARQRLLQALEQAGIDAQVQGRPKHIYSIWKKMQGKGLAFSQVLDVRALRVIVPEVKDCYAALSRVHEVWQPVPDEFDDYIARPKPNGYQSLHTVVRDEQGQAIEIQIRTPQMHERAESGVAAHWAYKEAGTRGYGGVLAQGDYEQQIAQARKSVLQQLLAWEHDLSHPTGGGTGGLFEDRIYVFTPQGTIIELPAGATPVDFAYSVHTDLGHRCRGARVDGAMVPLNTILRSAQTVEIIAAKELTAGPSLDWLNPDLGYLQSARARTKVRAWFNAQAQAQTIARGREVVEKLLQREGRTSVKLDELAQGLGFAQADQLFDAVGKDEYPLRQIEQWLTPAPPPADADELLAQKLARTEALAKKSAPRGGVMVVGMDSLLTQLARCCKPAPPDPIEGYVTRGKGVAVHRSDCSNLRHMAQVHPERLIDVTWSSASSSGTPAYAVDVMVLAHDRPGLLRDLCDVFAKDKIPVSAVQTHVSKEGSVMTLTVQTPDVKSLPGILAQVAQVPGVVRARRK
jgi:GTP pyrophosphokinase